MTIIKLVYLAGPYTGKTAEETALNIKMAEGYGREMARRGWLPVIPNMNTAGFHLSAPDINYEFWLEGYIELMKRCDLVLMLPGWRNSKGAVKEHAKALELNKAIVYCEYNYKDAIKELSEAYGMAILKQTYHRDRSDEKSEEVEGW